MCTQLLRILRCTDAISLAQDPKADSDVLDLFRKSGYRLWGLQGDNFETLEPADGRVILDGEVSRVC